MSERPQRYTMKIPLQLKCSQCNEPSSIRIHLDQTSFDWTCPKCGTRHPSLFGLNVTMGFLILERSRYELLNEKDYSMGIVMAAMAFDTELSRLFGKWKQIDSENAGKQFDREKCEEELRGFRTVSAKIDGVADFLVKRTMQEFVNSCPELREGISKNFKSIRIGSLVRDFQEQLFWPRNRILHWGDAGCSYEDAARCWSIANQGLQILRKMDEQRRIETFGS